MNYTILIYETAADFAVRNDADAKKREDYWAAWPPYSKALKRRVFSSAVRVCSRLSPPQH